MSSMKNVQLFCAYFSDFQTQLIGNSYLRETIFGILFQLERPNFAILVQFQRDESNFTTTTKSTYVGANNGQSFLFCFENVEGTQQKASNLD